MSRPRWIMRTRPLLRRWLGQRLAWCTNTRAPRWKPMVWHNPNWTTVRVGSRRHHLQVKSVWAYRRMRAAHPVARNEEQRHA